jgi:hypothetical protein
MLRAAMSLKASDGPIRAKTDVALLITFVFARIVLPPLDRIPADCLIAAQNGDHYVSPRDQPGFSF